MILVTGSKGMFGWGLKKVFKEDDLILTSKNNLDVTKIDDVIKYRDKKIKLIIHLAAETDHLAAELTPPETYFLNHSGTQNMVELARYLNIPIVYIGTCGMFNGEKFEYTENDTPDPLNHYSRSKYYGEIAVREYQKHYIIRSGWAMGGGPEIDKKFVNKIYTQMIEGYHRIYAIDNVYGTPTYTPDLMRTLKNITEAGEYGTFNVGNYGRASRYDVAEAFIRYLNLNDFIEVIPMSYDEYHKEYPVQVPYTRCEALDTSKIRNSGLSAMRIWQEALEEYTKECFK